MVRNKSKVEKVTKISNEEQREKAIAKEYKRLVELFKELSPRKKELVKRLLENAAFMAVTLEELTKEMNKTGVKEQYKNGNNQYGYKDSIETKTYDKMIKNYANIIKQLNDMLPKETGKICDDFDEFGDD